MLCFCRRHFIGAAAATLSTAAFDFPANAQGGLPRYCSMNGQGLSASDLYSSSGNPNFDRALIAELKHIISVVPVGPGFKFIRDPSPNAFALPDTYVSGTRGTVVLGLNLSQQELQTSQYGGVAVAGICAHECGHIFQFFSGYYERLQGPTAKHVELHADLVAGYYMGRRRQYSVDHIAVFARSVYAKGDYSFNDRNHHGTPDERFAAMKKGYEFASNNLSFDQAVGQGADFVGRM